MNQTYTRSEKFKLMIKIFWPILLSQVAMMSASFFDTIMSSQAGTEQIAGVSMGVSIWIPFQLALCGVLFAITPYVASKLGENASKESIREFFHQAIYISLIIGVVAVFLERAILTPALALIPLEPEVLIIAQDYLEYLAFGLIPLCVYTTIRCFFDGHGKTKTSMIISLSVLPFNIFFNYMFIFGNFGAPEMGGAGAGLATAIAYWAGMFIAFGFLLTDKDFKEYKLTEKFYKVNFDVWKGLFKLGVPIGFTTFFEAGIFCAFTLLMSVYSTEVIAAHQAALNVISMIYMIPLSIASTLTIIIGYETGANRFNDAKQYAKIGLFSSICLALTYGALLLMFRHQVALMYSTEAEVIAMIENFLILGALFMVSDALQASVIGILRGYKDVNFPFFATLFGYWVVGLLVGYSLAQFTPLGPYGLWIGFIAGLTTTATLVIIRLIFLQRKLNKAITT